MTQLAHAENLANRGRQISQLEDVLQRLATTGEGGNSLPRRYRLIALAYLLMASASLLFLLFVGVMGLTAS